MLRVQPLDWRVWLSGASSGIGEALARALVERGCRVALFARRKERLDSLRSEFLEAGVDADQVLIQPGDAADRDRVREAVREAEVTFGGIDVLVANAGIGDSLFPDRFDAEKVERIVRVNLLGPVYAIEAALPAMLARKRGVLVGVSSIGAVRGMPASAPYCASKAGLTTFLDSLRLDLHASGVDVVTVSPGFVRTPLTDRNRFPMPFLQTPERAAALIIRGIRRRRREVHFPWRLTVPLKLLACLPRSLSDRILLALSGGKGYRKEGRETEQL